MKKWEDFSDLCEAVNHEIVSLYVEIGFTTNDTRYVHFPADRINGDKEHAIQNLCETTNHKFISLRDSILDEYSCQRPNGQPLKSQSTVNEILDTTEVLKIEGGTMTSPKTSSLTKDNFMRYGEQESDISSSVDIETSFPSQLPSDSYAEYVLIYGGNEHHIPVTNAQDPRSVSNLAPDQSIFVDTAECDHISKASSTENTEPQYFEPDMKLEMYERVKTLQESRIKLPREGSFSSVVSKQSVDANNIRLPIAEYPPTTSETGDPWETESSIYELCSWLTEEPYYLDYISSASSLKGLRGGVPDRYSIYSSSSRRDFLEADFVVLSALIKIPWTRINRVVDSHVLETLSRDEIAMYSVKFEILTTERSHYEALDTLKTHFIKSDAFSGTSILSKDDRSKLFSHVKPCMKLSKLFLRDVGICWGKNILLTGIFDLICQHLEKSDILVSYCLRLSDMEGKLASLCSTDKKFKTALVSLEKSSKLTLTHYLRCPIVRMTDLDLLLTRARSTMLTCQEQRTSPDFDQELESCLAAYDVVKQICTQSEKKKEEKQRATQMMKLRKELEFPTTVKQIQIVDNVRSLEMRAEMISLGRNEIKNTLNAGGKRKMELNFKKSKQKMTLFLLSDLLLLTEKNKKSEKYVVADYCYRCDVTIASCLNFMCVDNSLMRDKSKEFKILLILEKNQDDKRIDILLSCSREEDRDKWLHALDKNRKDRKGEEYTNETRSDIKTWQCVYPYCSKPPADFFLRRGDEVSIINTLDNGWMEGVRKLDGKQGIFPPSRVAVKN